MGNIKIEEGPTIIEIMDLDDGVFAVYFKTYKDNGYSDKYKSQEIVVDTKNDCILTGNLPNILLKVLKKGSNENE